MRFLVDAQLPPALAHWLATQRHEAAHVGELGMQAAFDAAIWDHALASSSAIVTKDEDFALRKVLAEDGPVVVWIRLPNTRRREPLVWFAMVLPTPDGSVRDDQALRGERATRFAVAHSSALVIGNPLR